MRLLITRWKRSYRAVAVDDDGTYRFEVSGEWTKRGGRLYINATVADPGRDGQMVVGLARLLADAKRSGLEADEIRALIEEGVCNDLAGRDGDEGQRTGMRG